MLPTAIAQVMFYQKMHSADCLYDTAPRFFQSSRMSILPVKDTFWLHPENRAEHEKKTVKKQGHILKLKY